MEALVFTVAWRPLVFTGGWTPLVFTGGWRPLVFMGAITITTAIWGGLAGLDMYM